MSSFHAKCLKKFKCKLCACALYYIKVDVTNTIFLNKFYTFLTSSIAQVATAKRRRTRWVHDSLNDVSDSRRVQLKKLFLKRV